jgi:hypothetical protein
MCTADATGATVPVVEGRVEVAAAQVMQNSLPSNASGPVTQAVLNSETDAEPDRHIIQAGQRAEVIHQGETVIVKISDETRKELAPAFRVAARNADRRRRAAQSGSCRAEPLYPPAVGH